MRIEYRVGRWLVVVSEGDVETIVHEGGSRASAFQALCASGLTAAMDESKLLAEQWTADPLTRNAHLDESNMWSRDFTMTKWSWRDPQVSFVPLMWQSSNEGHYSAEMAGFTLGFSMVAEGGVRAWGRYFDNAAGVAMRDTVLARGFVGVSADPGKVEVEEVCLETAEDEWGTYCTRSKLNFLEYEVAGMTALGIPGMEMATVRHLTEDELAGTVSDDKTVEVTVTVASAQVAVKPPRVWFELPEPKPGLSGLVDVYGMPVEELLVDQGDGTLAVPLTITGDGRVFGHVARWGQCHTSYQDVCVTPPSSLSGYRHFHVGACETDGGMVSTGVLTVGCDHAPLRGLTAAQARDRYAHTGLGWADVRVVDGEFGPWACGAVRPDVLGNPDLLRVLRASAMSGDWRGIDGHLDMVAVLSVNTPGFPVLRASLGDGERALPVPRLNVAMSFGEPDALVAAGIVRRRDVGPEVHRVPAGVLDSSRVKPCGCGQMSRTEREMLGLLRVLDVRTRHLQGDAAVALAASLES